MCFIPSLLTVTSFAVMLCDVCNMFLVSRVTIDFSKGGLMRNKRNQTRKEDTKTEVVKNNKRYEWRNVLRN
ncbi:CLUMA_CG009859, isoform A [Clunio marinus]|uniref:CLUMA_CG009859, isoform A n=1 Tax=Clunio marinus TaxID=568069 RepID=A0A1J1I8A0_9DIPT|nr:CLUMA_CG009859, isoform A [Clunio marinus]